MTLQPVPDAEIPSVIAAMNEGRCVACYGEIDRTCLSEHELYCCAHDEADQCPEICECGYKVKWLVLIGENEVMPDWYFSPHRLEEDVVERDCPHGNGTVIEHCPKCDRKVGLWGFGVAGGMECECWDE